MSLMADACMTGRAWGRLQLAGDSKGGAGGRSLLKGVPHLVPKESCNVARPMCLCKAHCIRGLSHSSGHSQGDGPQVLELGVNRPCSQHFRADLLSHGMGRCDEKAVRHSKGLDNSRPKAQPREDEDVVALPGRVGDTVQAHGVEGGARGKNAPSPRPSVGLLCRNLRLACGVGQWEDEGAAAGLAKRLDVSLVPGWACACKAYQGVGAHIGDDLQQVFHVLDAVLPGKRNLM
mmetsp:Transcript_8286/g.23784  ORF Transcript_8286/g.23784 Transcript_8286/m.23784 type:complete len:233 (+) Transcript_8286:220-918(+)